MIDAGKVVAALDLNTSGFSKGIAAGKAGFAALADNSTSLKGKLDALSNSMMSIGKQMSVGVTAPILTAGTLAVKQFTTFDDAIRQVQATMGLTTENGAADILGRLRRRTRI